MDILYLFINMNLWQLWIDVSQEKIQRIPLFLGHIYPIGQQIFLLIKLNPSEMAI